MQRIRFDRNRVVRLAVPHWLRRLLPLSMTALMTAVVILMVMGGVLLGSPVAIAQESPVTPDIDVEDVSPNPPSLDADAIASEKVTQFVRSYLNVLDLIEQREGELQAAETDSESQRVQDEIEAAAIAIIEAEGMTLQEYVQLLGLVNSDPDFSERIALQLQEAGS